MNKKIKKILSKKNKSKIVCLTAYSKNIAEIIDSHADIVMKNCSLINVYTKEIQEKMDYKIANCCNLQFFGV